MARRRRRKTEKSKILLGFDTSDPKQMEALAEHIAGEVQAGKTMQEALEVPDELMESVYAMAFQKYQRGEYQAGADLFRYLLTLDEHCYKYLLGLAACLHGSEAFEEATRIYLYAHFHEPRDPVPLYHAGDCYLKLKDWQMAEATLATCITLAGDEERYSELKTRAELMVKTLEKKSEPSS